MFLIDSDANSIQSLRRETFSDLGYREREHLQEWIAKNPNCLGEELLIIQKEFDGWDETNERLDLLALDRKGGLVVIENKLDDSGRDVVWQSLKYAAYCSTLNREDVVELYRQYLKDEAEAAADKLLSFFEASDLNDVEINEGSNQRIILVAAKFRREVTATCLWLLERNIDMRCIRATPYSHEGFQFLSLDQIIPPPEAEEYMIKVGHKKVEENAARASNLARHKRRREFWTMFLENVTSETAELFSSKGPTIDSWLSGGVKWKSFTHWAVVTLNNMRYEFHLNHKEKSVNEARFDYLFQRRNEIETAFGEVLEWDRNDKFTSSKVFITLPVSGGDRSQWPEMIAWADQQVKNGLRAFEPLLPELSKVGLD